MAAGEHYAWTGWYRVLIFSMNGLTLLLLAVMGVRVVRWTIMRLIAKTA